VGERFEDVLVVRPGGEDENRVFSKDAQKPSERSGCAVIRNRRMRRLFDETFNHGLRYRDGSASAEATTDRKVDLGIDRDGRRCRDSVRGP
jgi:hypothetical protein